MSKGVKIWLIVAAVLTLSGLMIFAAAMSSLGWDFIKLSTAKYETSTCEIGEGFKSIYIDTDTADIAFEPSDDGKCRVVCYENVKAKHSAIVEEETLTIKETNNREWYDYIGINFGSSKITVYIPEKEFENITVKSSTGDISFGDLAAAKIDISVTTGKVMLCDIKCGELTTTGDTGGVYLERVLTDKMCVNRSTGHVELDACDSDEILIETDTGDVKGSLLSGKEFECETSTGDIDVPDTVGGKCRIKTSTGDIRISISE